MLNDKVLDLVIGCILTIITMLVVENKGLSNDTKTLIILIIVIFLLSIVCRRWITNNINKTYRKILNLDELQQLKNKIDSQKRTIWENSIDLTSQIEKSREITKSIKNAIDNLVLNREDLAQAEQNLNQTKQAVISEIVNLQEVFNELENLQQLMVEVTGDLEAAEQSVILRKVRTKRALEAAKKTRTEKAQKVVDT